MSKSKDRHHFLRGLRQFAIDRLDNDWSRVRRIRTDNGSEMVSEVVQDFLRQNGLLNERTSPYSPEENGMVERSLAVTTTRAISIMAQAGLDAPKYKLLFLQSLAHAARLSNMFPSWTRAASEPWLDDPVFGSIAFAHIDHTLRHKPDRRATRGLYCGHAAHHGESGRLFYALDTGVLTVVRALEIWNGVFIRDLPSLAREGIPNHSSVLSLEPQSPSTTVTVLQPRHGGATDMATISDAVSSWSTTTSSSTAATSSGIDTRGTISRLPRRSNSSATTTGVRERPATTLSEAPGMRGVPAMFDASAPRLTQNERRGSLATNTRVLDRMERLMRAREPHLIEMFPGRPNSSDPAGDVVVSRTTSTVETSGDSPPSSADYDERDPTHSSSLLLRSEERTAMHNYMAFHVMGKSRKDNWPKTVAKALLRPDATKWKDSILKEARSIIEKGTFRDEVWLDGVNTKPLPLMWVLTQKYHDDGSIEKYKARLVVLGHLQNFGSGATGDVYAPVASMNSVRMLFAMAAARGWHLEQTDFVTAFLNAEPGEEIFVSMDAETAEILREASSDLPEEMQLTNARFKRLAKSLYGTRIAPRRWWLELKTFLESIGFESNSNEPCLFRRGSGLDLIYFLWFVDDGICCGFNKEAIDRAKAELASKYEMKDLGACKRFLGLNVKREGGLLSLSQEGYIDEMLQRYNMEDCKPVTTPAEQGDNLSEVVDEEFTSIDPADVVTTEDDEDPTKYPLREAVGSLLFLSMMTRPDIGNRLREISRVVSNQPRGSYRQ